MTWYNSQPSLPSIDQAILALICFRILFIETLDKMFKGKPSKHGSWTNFKRDQMVLAPCISENWTEKQVVLTFLKHVSNLKHWKLISHWSCVCARTLPLVIKSLLTDS